jgi:hypothetical protein
MVTPTVTAPVADTAATMEEWWKPAGETTPAGSTGLIGTPSTYTPTTAATGTGYTSTGATAGGYAAKDWDVSRDQTVAGNIDDIVAADSPIMQRAATRADQQMNKRGLINSSMAVGAGQAAVMDAALPIAQQDAQTRAQSGSFNATSANRASEFGAAATNQANLANQAATNRASEFGAAASNQAALANQDATNRAAEYGANAANTLQAQSNTIRQQAAQLNADAANKLLAQDLDNKFKASVATADIASKVQLQQLADTTKIDLANIQATYQQMISSNEQAGALYGKVMQNITDIVNNPDILAADKTTAIENQKTMLKTGMEVVSAVSGLNLGSILTF